MFRELEPMYDRRLSSDMFASPTVGEMKTSVEQFKKDVSGDQVLDFIDPPGFIDSPRSVPFLLSFSNLSYSVRTPRKMKLLSVFRRDGIHGNEFPATTNGGEANVDGVKVLRKTKVLLNGVSGEAQEGEIMAVLGASGSGKSTLIDALANRISKDSLKGSITLNGEPLSSQLMKVISAYVMQDDILYPMLTVEETLTFAADFRLPKTLSNSQKKSRVQTLIDQLGLRNAAKTIIGDEGHRGVSGGERRRVSIGTDIIHDPIILFLDEPTSGLDSTSAFMVVQVLQRIARSGSIVIMSIHQPSYRILGLLDRLIFLSHGDTVYSGPPEMLPRFFEDFGHPINLDVENRTEFALDFIRELEGSRGGTKSMVEFYKTWRIRKNDRAQSGTEPSPAKGLSLKEAISASISHGKLVSGASNDDSSTSTMVPKYANSILTEITVLSKRSFMNSRRQPGRFGTRLAVVIVTGFILATVFSQLDDSPKGIMERLGFFAFAMSTTFYSCADTLPVFLQEKYIFIRETAYNAYRRISYCVSHAIVSLPSLTFLAFAFSAITFWSVGLEGGFFGFCFFFAITLSSFWAGNSFVTFVSCIVPYVILGYVVVIAVLAYFLLFSGFFINPDRIPMYWNWFHYISLVKYPYEAVLQNEFDNRAKCFVRGTQIFDNSPLSTVSEEMKEKLLEKMSDTLGYVITKKTCLMNGVDILKLQGMNDLSKWNCLWITIAWGVLFRVLFYFCLVLGSKNKRR